MNLHSFPFVIILDRSPIEQWDVLSVHDMHEMFSGLSSCNPNISLWDVSLVTKFVSEFIIVLIYFN